MVFAQELLRSGLGFIVRVYRMARNKIFEMSPKTGKERD